jgi:hypothetical protein
MAPLASTMGEDVVTAESLPSRARAELPPPPGHPCGHPVGCHNPAITNLILLCQWHHTAVHEGGVTITGAPDRWLFSKPDGRPCDHWVDDENLARHLAFAQRRHQTQHDQLAAVDSFQHPEAHTIRPRWVGEPFDLHACVQALFTIKLPKPTANLDQQAA